MTIDNEKLRCEIFTEHEANTSNYTEYLPSVERAKENLDKEIEIKRQKRIKEILDKNLRNDKMNKGIFSLIFGVLALLFGALFAYGIIPAGWETTAIAVVSALASSFGVTDWRKKFGIAKEWYKSKSIVFAILGSICLIALIVVNVFSFGLPAIVITIINSLLGIFGAGTLWGIFEAVNKK